MTSLTATTSMKDWISSGWTITPGYILGLAGPPSLPPGATGDILSGWNPPADALRGEFKLVGVEDYRDHIEDLALAEQMLEEYETQGIEGTIPYSVYRARRLGRVPEYDIRITPHAERDLERLSPSEYRRVDKSIWQLAQNPRPFGVAKLHGDVHRIRVGPWRVIYIIDDGHRVVVLRTVRRREKDTYR